MSNECKWYIINVTAGKEYKVCEEINKLAKEEENKEFIKEAFVPFKKVFKHIRGKKVEVEQKLFPNYVFVNMFLDEDKKFQGKIQGKIPAVRSFLGKGGKPEEVPEEKIEKLKNRINEDNSALEENNYEVGDNVTVTEGPFESFTGTIESKISEKNILRISISIFGRPTVIDIDAGKVEKV